MFKMSPKVLKFHVKSKTKEIDNKNSRSDPKIYLNELNYTSAFISNNKNMPTTGEDSQAPTKLIGAETLYEHFQECMWLMLWLGFCMGMNPIVGFNSKVSSDVRFTVFSIRFVVVLLVMAVQLLFGAVFIYQLMCNFTLFKLSYVAFYLFAGFINLSLIRVATKWPTLVKEINKSRLYCYIDPNCKRRCNIYVIVFMIIAIGKYLLSQLVVLLPIIECQPVDGVHLRYSKITYSWLFNMGVPKSFIGMILLQIHSVITTLIQTYSDIFVICVSTYLSSIYYRINAKITKTASKNGPPSAWRALRADYNRAARLVRCFDDSVNTLVFISYASNLFFICFQLFNLFGFGIFSKSQSKGVDSSNCTAVGIYESSESSRWNLQAMYQIVSILFLVGRFICVTLITAKINSRAVAPNVVLYNLSPDAYCDETERLLEQINNDTVALSGFKLFYVTKGLLLSVFATIITYELVLVQYSEHFELIN